MATICDVPPFRAEITFGQFVQQHSAEILEQWRRASDSAGVGPHAIVEALLRNAATLGDDCRLEPTALPDAECLVPSEPDRLIELIDALSLMRRQMAQRIRAERPSSAVADCELLASAFEATVRGLLVDGTRIQPTSLPTPCTEDQKTLSPGEQRELFLSEASRVLAESLDYEETLRTVARLAVPRIADLCSIDLLQEDGTLQRVATEHRDPQRAVLTAALHRNPPSRDAATGLPNVIRTRTTEYVPHMSEALLQEREHDPERLRILRGLGLSSTICVPLVARNRLLGAITLSTEQGRALTPEHVRMTEDLARRAATAIDNARLYHDAQRALRAREEILAIVTHDLRTPLSAIMAGASLLRSADPALLDAERVRQRADAIQRSAQHMSRLVQDLADLAQIDAGHLSIARTPQDPASLVREVVVDLQPTAAQRDSVLRCATLAELPMVSIDRDRVRQVFTNLIGNASKAGASTIEVGARPREADVMFWVSDDGPGISSEELPRMFERYWRSRSAGYQGTGLGLPIASGIVKAHGGRMWVESTLGAGSTFFFAIPRDEPH